MMRHNDLYDGVSDLDIKSFTPLHMYDVPLFHPGFTVWEGKAQITGSANNNPPTSHDATEHKGDILIHNLWHRGKDSIHDMRVVNTDALYYQNKSPYKCLQTEEK